MSSSNTMQDGFAAILAMKTGKEYAEDKYWLPLLFQLEDVERYYLSYSGKLGYNPSLYLAMEVLPLKDRYRAGERTEALAKSIRSLTCKPPITRDAVEVMCFSI